MIGKQQDSDLLPEVQQAREKSKWFSQQIIHVTNGVDEIDFKCPKVLQVLAPHLEKCNSKRTEMLKPYHAHLDLIQSVGKL